MAWTKLDFHGLGKPTVQVFFQQMPYAISAGLGLCVNLNPGISDLSGTASVWYLHQDELFIQGWL